MAWAGRPVRRGGHSRLSFRRAECCIRPVYLSVWRVLGLIRHKAFSLPGGLPIINPEQFAKEGAMAVGSVGSATSSSTSALVSDPRDLNRDGKVTEMEIQQYDRTHPKADTKADTKETVQAKSDNLLDVTV